MKSIVLLVTFSIVAVSAVDIYSEVCYGNLGCFSNRPPFSTSFARPVALLPSSPEEIGTRFYLYNKNNSNTPVLLSHAVESEEFETKPTKFIIHGFLQNHVKDWIINTKDALLKVEDCNVVLVDWSRGNQFPYTRATANAQLVGAEIARLLKSLLGYTTLDLKNVHLIGHNLGAHVAGYAGARLSGLGRITGLDPAGPYFENTDRQVRLDESDADFVDIIHTDGAGTTRLGLGLMQRSGHVDFYPNGGKNQKSCPGTSQKLLGGIFSLVSGSGDGSDSLGCSTLASTSFFLDSILNEKCNYAAYPCGSIEEFNKGTCIRCSALGCNFMGYWASKNKDIGMLYLNTYESNKFPYCQFAFTVALNSNDLPVQTQTRGRFTLELQGEKGNTTSFVFDNSEFTFRPGSTELRLVTDLNNIGETVKGAIVKFDKTTTLLSSWLYQNEWSFKNIEVNYGNTQYYVKLCPEENILKSGGSMKFTKCSE